MSNSFLNKNFLSVNRKEKKKKKKRKSRSYKGQQNQY